MEPTKYETETCVVATEEQKKQKAEVAEEKGGKGLAVFLLIMSAAFMGLGIASVILKWDPAGAHGGGGGGSGAGASPDAGLSGGLSAPMPN